MTRSYPPRHPRSTRHRGATPRASHPLAHEHQLTDVEIEERGPAGSKFARGAVPRRQDHEPRNEGTTEMSHLSAQLDDGFVQNHSAAKEDHCATCEFSWTAIARCPTQESPSNTNCSAVDSRSGAGQAVRPWSQPRCRVHLVVVENSFSQADHPPPVRLEHRHLPTRSRLIVQQHQGIVRMMRGQTLPTRPSRQRLFRLPSRSPTRPRGSVPNSSEPPGTNHRQST